MEKETLEEAAERIYPINIVVDYDTNEDIRNIWIEGAKWQAERMYSEEDLREVFKIWRIAFSKEPGTYGTNCFQIFKKK
jgi:hypothetical protein